MKSRGSCFNAADLKACIDDPSLRGLFGLSEDKVDEWTATGFLRPTRIGRQVYVLYADLPPLFAGRILMIP
jgi:hypothetical protein